MSPQLSHNRMSQLRPAITRQSKNEAQMFRRIIAILTTFGLLTLTLADITAPKAEAHQASVSAPSPGSVVSAVPSAMTPQVDNGEVWAVAQVGNTLVFGGTFTSVGGQTRTRLAAVNATTGALSTTFVPTVNNQVYNLLPGPNDHTVYVAGAFTQINGTDAQFLALLDTNTGQIDTSFKPPAFNYGLVRDIAKVGNRLFIGGFFTRVGGIDHGGIATLNATTGALDPFMNVQLAGHHNDSGGGAQGWVGPWALDVNASGTRLVLIGNFKTADGLLRDQLVMIDIDGSSAAVDPDWATNRYSPYCFNWAFDSYVRGVTFSPDGSYFVVNATGGGNQGTLCDATARFDTSATGTDIQPTWVDETGGDTVWGVTITDNAIYIGGHNRWNNNPQGVDQAQPGAVPRPGMAALDPASGRPYTWNPGHNPLGVAVYAYLATSTGLWMGYDNNYIGDHKYKRQKLVFFPYEGGYVPKSTSVGKLPGAVYLGDLSTNGQSNILYRVDAGGPAVGAGDGGPDWAEDTSSNPSRYRNSQGNAADWSPGATMSSSVPAGTPSAIFDHELWSPSDSPPMTWDFPVAADTHTKVRLYFANRCTCTSSVGQRAFDVSIDGNQVLDNYDIVADVGDQTATMKSFDVTAPSSGDIQIKLTHVTENPLINGIEIINEDLPAPPPPSDNLSAVAFDGTTAQPAQQVSNSTIPWGQTRGAFTVGDQLFYGSTDGYLYRASVDGGTFGSPSKVDPYHDPVWDGVDTHDGTTFDGSPPTLYSQLPSVTGMFYQAGKLYFTLSGSSSLRWAWFSPDSGIADNTEHTVDSSVDFSRADGMFVSGNTLYYVNKSDESLYSANFSDGSVTGAPTLVNGPASGGVDWTNKSLFFVAAPAVNRAPTAAFGSDCVADGCAFDASGSSDSDGSVVSYAWDFGDGSTGSGVSPSHSYTRTDSYNVKLTVTDDQGATDSVTHSVSVTVTSTGAQIGFVGASHSPAGISATKSVKVPAAAEVGDTMLLVMTTQTTVTWSDPGAGWTQVGSPITNVTIRSTAWTRTVVAGDPGSTITLTGSKSERLALSLSVYSGVSTSDPVDAFAQSVDPGGTSHTTPNVTASAGDWVVSLWTDKSSAVSAWSVPSSLTERDTATDTGAGGRMSFAAADSAGPVASGSYGGMTATTNASSDKAIMWSIALTPGS